MPPSHEPDYWIKVFVPALENAVTACGCAVDLGEVRSAIFYGTDRKHLDQTARSPNRWSKTTLPYMTYRVPTDGLAPGTAYYDTVDAAQADGIPMRLKSPVNKFATPPRP